MPKHPSADFLSSPSRDNLCLSARMNTSALVSHSPILSALTIPSSSSKYPRMNCVVIPPHQAEQEPNQITHPLWRLTGLFGSELDPAHEVGNQRHPKCKKYLCTNGTEPAR